MKKFSIIVVIFLTISKALGQIQNGKNVLATSLSNFSIGSSKSETTSSINLPQSSSSTNFYFNPDLMVGKIKNSRLFSYGVSLSFTCTQQMNAGTWRMLSIAPIIEYQKFYKITDRIFISPIAKLSAGYKYGKQDAYLSTSAQIQKGKFGSLAIYPFSTTFQVNPRTNFVFSISRISIEYDRTKAYFEPQLRNELTISRNFLFSGTINSIGFGIQKILN